MVIYDTYSGFDTSHFAGTLIEDICLFLQSDENLIADIIIISAVNNYAMSIALGKDKVKEAEALGNELRNFCRAEGTYWDDTIEDRNIYVDLILERHE